MKIAIPADENRIDTTICMSYGRTPFFCIYDTESKEKSFLDNSAAASTGGAGIKASQSLVNEGVEVVLTPRAGENAVEVLDAAGIKTYKTINDNLDENIKAYEDGELSPLIASPGMHGHN